MKKYIQSSFLQYFYAVMSCFVIFLSIVFYFHTKHISQTHEQLQATAANILDLIKYRGNQIYVHDGDKHNIRNTLQSLDASGMQSMFYFWDTRKNRPILSANDFSSFGLHSIDLEDSIRNSGELVTKINNRKKRMISITSLAHDGYIYDNLLMRYAVITVPVSSPGGNYSLIVGKSVMLIEDRTRHLIIGAACVLIFLHIFAGVMWLFGWGINRVVRIVSAKITDLIYWFNKFCIS